MMLALAFLLGMINLTVVAEAGGEEAQKQSANPKALSCKAHGVPKSDCYMCNPALREKGRMWCNEHNRYEDRCWICHPEAQDKTRPFCSAHYLYEDECYLCHPELKKKDKPSNPAPAGEQKTDKSN
jgi:cobalt-zinc-cadmium efflux system membrane fusion protein